MSHTSEPSPHLSAGNIKLSVPNVNINSNLKDLNTKRSSVKGRLTKYRNLLDSLICSDTKIERTDLTMLTQRFERLKELLSYFDDVQSQIELLNAASLDAELDKREEIEADFSMLIAKTESFLEKNHSNYAQDFKSAHSLSGTEECNNSCQRHSRLSFKLPTIKIANFDGTYFKWLEFRDTFTSLIHSNDKIEPIHKFHYLNSYLEGEASRVIGNLQVSTANYAEAWHLLCQRYNNEKQLINNHLNSLCNIPPVTRDSAQALRFLIDHISKNLRALNTLGEPTESWDTLIIHLVSGKLDSSTGFKWEEHKNNFDKSPTLNDFFSFLKRRADILESIRSNKIERHGIKNDYTNNSSSFHKHDRSHTKSFVISAPDNSPSSSSPACILCNGSHRLYDCASFLARPIKERIAEAMRLKVCLNCLRKGHSSRQCRLGPCSRCKMHHNTLLHRESSQAVNQSSMLTTTSVNETEVEQEQVYTDDSVCGIAINVSNGVLLSTALIDIYSPYTKKYVTVRALLDSGSQSSLITKDLQNILQLTPQPTRVGILGVGNVSSSNALQRCNIEIKSKYDNFVMKTSCLVLPEITGHLPSKTFDITQLKLPPNVQFADPYFNQSAPIDLLIGADIFWNLIEAQQISLGTNNLIMRKTKLGWILAGPLCVKGTNSVYCNIAVSNETLNEELKRFWEIENVPNLDISRTDEEIACEEHFKANTHRNDQGRFCVKLPLVSEPDSLGDSFRSAKRQFLSLEKRFSKNPELRHLYQQFIQEYSNLGHLSESPVLIPRQSYFIPHHAVLKPTSETTKLRVVFNGSEKTTSGYSINDLQMIGPTIQDSLLNILLRFRQHTYVLSGDIEKMYRQIEMQDSDRNLQMILWRNYDTDPIKSLRLNTVTYGYSSSSFLSTRCLWQLGEDCSDPKIKNIIQRDFLVDDLLTGCDSEDELNYIKEAVENTLSAGCFRLRKYRSNLPSILVKSQATHRDLIISSSSHTLGVGWNPNEDYIHFPTNYKNTKEIPTKRSILSDSCKVFDPLGLLSLVTIKPKILIQKLWLENVGWDEPAPNDIIKLWQEFIDNMKYIQDLHIPRHSLCKSPISIELHCFCDASKSAYAACIFLRSINCNGEVTVRLLCAKAKVSSVKPQTIPRLELGSCLLGAQLAGAVCSALRCIITRRIFWTDSSIVLAWLGMRYDLLKTFVANRVSAIHELTDKSEWRHVPTTLNPADLASRGIEANKINNLDLWWNGPAFLRQNESSWPTSRPKQQELPDVKVNITTCNVDYKQSLIDFDRYSKLNTLQRSFAYVLRFIHNFRSTNNKQIGTLQPEELSNSFEHLVKLCQEESFLIELKSLRANEALTSKHYLTSLSPFLDSKNILRVGGRLTYSSYPFEKRHPIILHSKHRFTKLLFQREHIRLLHAGPQLLLSSVREFVWPIAGRDLARTTARQCVTCRKAIGKTLTPMMGSLPEQRVNSDFPFISTGVDFAGPFMITDRRGRGCKITKCYLCLFICFRYKCVHLEAVSELSKDAFILSLRRFISRRGKPVEIFCDNGRNFVAASKELADFLCVNSNDICEFSSEQGIKFNFQPAYAPHFGGLWEAGVKSVKFHLKRTLGSTHLTFEELATLFCQVEAILNSRPLYPLSSCPDDLHPLTPGHFLIGRPLTSLPTLNVEDKAINKLDRFQRLEQLRRQFWHRWQLEYLAELQQRHKWRTPGRQLQIDDLVILKEENTPPMNWRMGRITNLFPGKDGVTRVAEVKTMTGTFRRAVRYLCPLLEPTTKISLEATASKAPEDVTAHH